MTESHDRLRCLVINAVIMALGLTLPFVFHLVGLGSKFLPMLLPLLLNGFISSFRWAVFTGFVTPLASALLTGMPPLYPPMALAVAAEGAVLAGVAAGVNRAFRRNVWPALIAAVVCGRMTAAAAVWLLARSFELPPGLSSAAVLAQGLPGVALQLAAVPLALRALSKRRGILFEHIRQHET